MLGTKRFSDSAKTDKNVRCIFWLSIVFNALAFAAAMAHNPPVWYTNDDFRMMTIVSGAYTGTPSPDTVFMRYPVGLLLAGLYCLTSAVPWYGLFTMACMYVPACVFCYYIVKKAYEKNVTGLGIGLYILLFVFMIQKYICLPQFTLTSAFMDVCAMVLLLEMPDERNGKHIAFASVCAVISFCVRSKAFYLLVPAMALIIGVRIWKDHKKGAKYLWFCAGTLVLCAVVLLVDMLAWSGPDYQEFREFKEQRAAVYDYASVPGYYDHISFYNENGISEVTYRAISGKFLDIDETVNSENLEKIADYTDRIEKESDHVIQRIWHAFQNSLSRWFCCNDTTVKYCAIFVTALLFVSVALSLRKKESGVIFFALVAGMLLENTCFEFIGRITVRVMDLMLLAMAVVGCLAVLDLIDPRKRSIQELKQTVCRDKTQAIFSLLAVCAVAVFLAAGMVNMQDDLDSRAQTLSETTNTKLEALMGYTAENPDAFYFYDALDFIACSTYAFQTYEEGTVLNNESIGSWNIRSPLYYARNEQFGFHSSIDGLLSDSCDVYFITSSSPKMGITKTLKDQYNRKLVEVDRIQSAKDILYVYAAVDDE